MSHIFHGVQFCVDFASSLLSFKEKQEIRRNIVDNGGTLSYILTKQISYLVTANSERTLSSYKGRTAVKNGIAVVSIDFVKKCIKSGKLLDPQPYLLSETRDSQNFSSGKIACQSEVNKKQTKSVKKLRLPDINKIEVWKYRSADAPLFNEQSYEIAKDLVLKGTDSSGSIVSFYSLELHVVPPQVPCSGSRYRLFTHHGNLKRLREGDPGTKECRYFSTVEDALDAYTALYTQQTQAPYSLTRAESVLSHKIGSDKMIQITVSEYCPEEDTMLSPEVANLIDFIWNEATGSLSDILAVPADSIKLEDVEKAEAVLLLLKKSLDSAEDSSVLKKLSDEFFSIIPHKNTGTAISSKCLIAQKQDLCQLIKDMVSVGESTNWLTRRSLYSKYRALKCHIEWLQHESDEFKKIQEHVNASETSPSNIQVLNVFSIMRPVEEGTFSHDIQNKKLLFHSSKVTNFVGIHSRGLLMPKIIVEDFGGKRSDAGMLGSGIYFASSASTSAKYSAAASNGTRLMLVNEVALGNIKELRKFSMDLTSAPTGFDSCHGVQSTEGEPSDFKDDEFAVYSGNQQRLRYLVEFVLPGDNVLPRDDVSLDSGFSDEEVEDMEGSTVDLSDVMSVVDPLTKVEAGLKGTGDKPLPLQSVHIRAKLLDLAAQVIVFQAYENNSSSPIEAKYVFPLDDMAAVCGFEAFINGKHIVGEVKEKEQAHKEYREAISQGHGAYLMDEETPDVFTVSVGNLPPGAQVLIKITYVAELLVEREHICFSLPGSVAPWKRNKALEEITQTDVDTVHIDEKGSSDVLDVSVEVSVEMPFDIRTIDSPSHSIRIKRTATKAVVSLEHGQSLEDGFQLLIGLAEIHVPRMWVERHISKPDSQACMLTFYPEFEAEIPQEVEVLFLLDLSCSMKGPPLDDAKKILLMCLSLMNKDWIFNILVFGSKHFELFPSSKRNDPEAYKDAVKFVQSLSATKGSTELWRVLQKLSLLPAVSSGDHPRNLFLISDGHVTEEETTLSLIHKNYRSDRLFTFGVGATANRYYLRAMSKAGAGASEFFDSKVKSKWERKVKSQLSKAKQPGLTSVAVSWQQHDSGSSPPVQAPHQILSLFNGSRQVVYGFVDNCTQATLSAEVNGKTVSTMVYTSDLNITTGKILHQLTARALIRDWDEGSLHEQRTGHEVVKRNRKDYIITISKEFSVVSKFTSFVAVEHREKDEKFEEGQGPSIEELVAAEEIDILQYIGWEQKPADTDRRREPCIEEKLEKQLQEAKVLETCAVLQCERLYNDVMKEAHNKLGPDHPLTTKTAYALSNLYESVFGDKEKALQVIIDIYRDGYSEDENFEDSEDDDSSSDEWSEQDELPEALLMQQDDQEKRSTTNGSSRSGSVIGDKEEKKLVDEVDGEEEEEEDLQQIEDSSIEEVDKRRREKGSDRKCLTNVTLDNNDDDLLDYDEEDVLCEEMSIDWDSAPSEVVEQDMFRAISKPVSFSFLDDEEEESEDDVGFGVYGAFKKFAGKVTNKALQREESPKYSPTSPSLEIEETTLSLSNKELERSRSKGVSTRGASDLLESAESVPEPQEQIGLGWASSDTARLEAVLASTRRGRPARKPALQGFSFDQSTQQLLKPPPPPPFPPPPPGASVTTAPPPAYAPPGAEIVGGGLHTSEAASAIVKPGRPIRPPPVESSLSGFSLNSVDPDRRGVCFGSSSVGEVGGFGLLAHEKKQSGLPATGLFGSAPDRQGFSFGSPSSGEIVGFGQPAHKNNKPGFPSTGALFGSAPDRQGSSFGSPSSGEILGFGQPAHKNNKPGFPSTVALFGSAPDRTGLFGQGSFGTPSSGFGLSTHEKKKSGLPATGLLRSAPDRQGSSFGSPASGEIVGFGQPAHKNNKPGFPSTGALFGSAPDRQGFSFGSPSSGEIGGFGQSAHKNNKPGFPSTGALFGSAPDRQGSSFGSPSSGEIGGFGQSAHKNNKPGFPSTGGLFGSAPDRTGLFGQGSFGSPSSGFGLSTHEKKKSGLPATGLFGSAPDRQGSSFGSPSSGEIVGFGQPAHENKPGFPSTGGLFGSAPDRTGLFGQGSFGSPSSGFGLATHEKKKSGIPATGLFGSSQSAPSIVGGGFFGNREPRLLAGQSEFTTPSFSSGQQSFGSVPSVTSGGGSLFGVPIPAVQAVTVVKDGGEKAEIIEERTGNLEESDGSLADIDFHIAMSKKKKKKRAVIIEEESTQLSTGPSTEATDETEPSMPITQDQAVPAYPFLRSTWNLPTSLPIQTQAPSSVPPGPKSSVPPSHHPPPPPPPPPRPPPPPPSPPCSVDPVTTVPPAPPFPPLIVGGDKKRNSSLRPPPRPPAGISVPTPPFSSRVSASAPSRRQQLLSSIKSSVPAASFGGHRTTVHSALMRAQQQLQQQQQQQALFARSDKGMTMQTDIPVAVSEGVTNRACDSAVSETFEESGSVASPEATLLSQLCTSRVLSRGGSPDRQGIMAEEERTDKKVNVEERERKIRLIERRRALSNRIQHDRNETMEKIFAKQNPDGFWNVDDLSVIGISKRNFINFLGNAGARSLGPKVFELALQLLSTLVILAFIKLRLLIDIPLSLPLGKKRELKVDGLGEPYSKNITAALRWIKIQEQKIPLLYSRLEFGVNWDVATRNIVQEMAV